MWIVAVEHLNITQNVETFDTEKLFGVFAKNFLHQVVVNLRDKILLEEDKTRIIKKNLKEAFHVDLVNDNFRVRIKRKISEYIKCLNIYF